jgi:hypothetical protein
MDGFGVEVSCTEITIIQNFGNDNLVGRICSAPFSFSGVAAGATAEVPSSCLVSWLQPVNTKRNWLEKNRKKEILFIICKIEL